MSASERRRRWLSGGICFGKAAKKRTKGAKGVEVGSRRRWGEKGKPVFVLSREGVERQGGGTAKGGREKTRICVIWKRGGQNGSTLIPTTDLRNYYRLSG